MTHRRTAHVTLQPGTGTITLDGTELRGVVGCEIRGHTREFPTMVVALILHEMEIDGQMQVTVPPKTAASLAALGWTPPTGQALDSPEQPHAFRHSCGTLQDGVPGEDGTTTCAGCRLELHPNDPIQRYVLVQIGGEPDAAAG